MKHVPGPDFPTGGRICGRQAIRDAYTTGRGILEVRAKCHIERGRQGKQQVVIDELPYQVNKKTLIDKIVALVKDDKISGISDVRDESADDMRLCVVVKRGEDPEIILNQLYKFTQLRESFSVIMIALVDGRPELLSLKRILEQYVRHRKDVITRRTRYLLRRRRGARAHRRGPAQGHRHHRQGHRAHPQEQGRRDAPRRGSSRSTPSRRSRRRPSCACSCSA